MSRHQDSARIPQRMLARLLTGASSGQTLVEYSLILVVVSLGTLAAMTFLRNRISFFFSQVGDLL